MYHDQIAGDSLTAQLHALGRKSSALRKRGICDHGLLQGPGAGKTGPAKCLHCGTVFPSIEAAREEHSRLLHG